MRILECMALTSNSMTQRADANEVLPAVLILLPNGSQSTKRLGPFGRNHAASNTQSASRDANPMPNFWNFEAELASAERQVSPPYNRASPGVFRFVFGEVALCHHGHEAWNPGTHLGSLFGNLETDRRGCTVYSYTHPWINGDIPYSYDVGN